ncbi:MAG: nitroreductase family protein [Anaerolineaceae bacterium]|nr:nitroreductase family protein [Anaerolineaceae bacterium]
MQVFEAIHARHTVRKFSGAPVPIEDIEKIVDAARLAASGNNRQPWEFIAVTQPQVIEKLCVPTDHWLRKAGVVIAVVMDPESRWWVEDGAAAVQNMLLACTALGYGACWMEGYSLRNEELLRAVLAIPASRRLLTLLAIGVPEKTPVKEKKTLSEVLYWQRYPENTGTDT